jgi:peptide/nickel transport system permease protein
VSCAQRTASLAGYAARRAAWSIVQFVLIAFLLFFILHLVAGDQFAPPAFKRLAPETERSTQLREAWGLDRPLVLRFVEWFWVFIRGGFGASIWSMEPPDEFWWEGNVLWASESFDVAARMAWSLLILGGATLFVSLTALLLGVHAAIHPGSGAEHAALWIERLFSWMPGYLLALGLLLTVSHVFFTGRAILSFETMTGPYRAWPLSAFRGIARIAWQALTAWLVIALPVFAHRLRRIRVRARQAVGPLRLPLAAKGLDRGPMLFRNAARLVLPDLLAAVPRDLNFLLGGALIAGELFGLPTFGAFYLSILPRNAHAGLVLSCLLWYVALLLVVRFASDMARRLLAADSGDTYCISPCD